MEQSTSPPPTPINETKGKCRKCLITTLILEFLLVCLVFSILIVFVFLWPMGREYAHRKILAKVRLAPMSEGNTSWTIPPATTIRAYRLFNITNYMNIMTEEGNTLMEFAETEPLHYKVTVSKNNVEWLDNNTKIHYSVERFFMRHGEYSESLMNQEGAFIDVPRVLLRTKFQRIPGQAFFMLGGNNAFNYSKAIDKLEGFISPTFAAVASRMQGPNRDKSGFIYRYNGSNGFNYTIKTGIYNSAVKGQMVNFSTEYTPFNTTSEDWYTTLFDGLTFPPLGDPPNRKVINLFQPDLCRPVQLRYNRTVSKFGFRRLHEYVLKLVDVKKCPTMDEDCPEADRLDVTNCSSSELPEDTIVLTKPHLFGHNASSTFVNFKPDFDQHESTIYFEPVSGTPIRAQLRIQLNTNAWIDRLRLNPDGSTDPLNYRAVRRFVPMLWIDQTIKLNEDVVERLQSAQKLLHYGNALHQWLKLTYIIIAFVSITAILIVIEIFCVTRRNKLNKSVLFEAGKDQEKALLNPSNGTATVKA